MSMAVGPNQGIKSEINVTPLVDVVLVLLIIFMVVTPMLQRGKDVRLPKAQKIEEDNGGKSDPIIVSITPDKKLYVERDEVEDAAFQERIRSELTTTPNRAILLKGDESLTYGDIRKVMNLARKGGAKGVGLGVE